MPHTQAALTEGVIDERAAGAIGELTSAVSNLIGGLTTAFGIIVLGIYFALEPQLYQRGFAWLLPMSQRAYFADTAQQMGHTLRRLMAGRLAGMTLEGLATWLLLGWWGVPMAALLGLLTGLLAFLPNIGAPISGAIMILVGFSDSTSTGLRTSSSRNRRSTVRPSSAGIIRSRTMRSKGSAAPRRKPASPSTSQAAT